MAPDRVSTTTDAAGAFTFKNLPKGGHYMIASAPGYATRQVSNLHFDKEEIVVRDVTRYRGLDGCLRISVGTPEENRVLLAALSRREEAA